MRISMMGRHMREGLRNLVRNGWMTFASMMAVAITLTILGSSLTVALNAQQMSNYVASQVEVDVLLNMTITDAQGQQIAQEIKSFPGVQSVQYISKEQGMKMLKDAIGQTDQQVLDGLSLGTTLPVKIVVKATDPRQTVNIGEQIKGLPGVDKVNDGQAIVDRLFRFLDVVRNIGLVFVAALVVTAMFLISNTIKITIVSRRREIEIMKLVGATDWFIRWPFMMEGVVIGAIGALLPYALIMYGYYSMYTRLGGAFLALPFPLLPTLVLAQKLAIVLFGVGVFIGIWGGAMSIRRFLRV